MQKIVPVNSILIPTQASLMFKGVIYDTYQWKQQLFDGSHTTFEMLRRPDTVTTICVVGDKIIVINDEQPHRGHRLGFPGGRVNETDPDVVSAAKREVLEETGYEFNQWKLLKVWQPQRKIEWFIYLFVAWDGKQDSGPKPDGGEKILLELLPLEYVQNLATNKKGVLGESEEILSSITNVDELIALPEFEGKLFNLTAS